MAKPHAGCLPFQGHDTSVYLYLTYNLEDRVVVAKLRRLIGPARELSYHSWMNFNQSATRRGDVAR